MNMTDMHFFDQEYEASKVGGVLEIPSGIEDKRTLLDLYSRAFNFPDWFGYNWDALLDCLRDVGTGVRQIIIRHSDIPFLSSPKYRTAYLDVLFLTCTLHKGSIVAIFPSELLDEVDRIIFEKWKGDYPNIRTKEDVQIVASKIVFLES